MAKILVPVLMDDAEFSSAVSRLDAMHTAHENLRAQHRDAAGQLANPSGSAKLTAVELAERAVAGESVIVDVNAETHTAELELRLQVDAIQRALPELAQIVERARGNAAGRAMRAVATGSGKAALARLADALDAVATANDDVESMHAALVEAGYGCDCGASWPFAASSHLAALQELARAHAKELRARCAE